MTATEGATVRLTVPAQTRFARVARMTTSSLVATWGADIDDVEDLRIAVDELVTALVPTSSDGEIELTLVLSAGELRAEGSTAADSQPNLDQLTREIVSAVVDELVVELHGSGRARFEFRKRLVQPSS
jgi:anti-sigma regulatory factor (Ser/Thr protein kinase)